MRKQKEIAGRNRFRDEVYGRINVKLIENQMSQGTPDAICINRNGVSFWIEIKALDDWPVRVTTCPLRAVFEPGQVAFLKEWISWCGHAFVLLFVGREAYLLDPKNDGDMTAWSRTDITYLALAAGLKEIAVYLEELK